MATGPFFCFGWDTFAFSLRLSSASIFRLLSSCTLRCSAARSSAAALRSAARLSLAIRRRSFAALYAALSLSTLALMAFVMYMPSQ